MAVIFLDTETASDIDHGADAIVTQDGTIDLGQYSLNAVVGRNKSLWRLPQQWTQAHLRALCVDRRSDADVDDLDQHKDGLFRHALIPDLHQDHLKRFIRTMTQGVPPRARAVALNAMLVFPRPKHEDIDVDDSGSPRPDIEAEPFSHYGDCIMELAVGQRAYRLPLLFNFHLGPLVLPYLDSAQIDQPLRRVHRSHLSNQPYEPCITAILIAMAQGKGSSLNESVVIQTQLIFTHRDDDQDMHVYTAHVTQPLLERFRHPNRPPTTCACSHITPSLLELQHMRVPYKPNETFRCRILAAVSVTATTMHKNDYFGRRKRKPSYACDTIDFKRRRREGPRTPLYNLDPNRYHA